MVYHGPGTRPFLSSYLSQLEPQIAPPPHTHCRKKAQEKNHQSKGPTPPCVAPSPKTLDSSTLNIHEFLSHKRMNSKGRGRRRKSLAQLHFFTAVRLPCSSPSLEGSPSFEGLSPGLPSIHSGIGNVSYLSPGKVLTVHLSQNCSGAGQGNQLGRPQSEFQCTDKLCGFSHSNGS